MESVNVLFLVPDIHDLQTGGNVFNRRIVEELRPETPVRIVRWNPDETPTSRLDFSPSSGIVQNAVGIVEFGGTGNDLSFSRIYSPAQQTYQHLFRCRSHFDALRCIAVFVAHCGWDANIVIKRPE